MAKPVLERFWSHVTKSERNCWIWGGEVDNEGVPRIYLELSAEGIQRWQRTARFAYHHLKAPLPDKASLKRKCRAKKCVNPDHYDLRTYGTQTKLTDKQVEEIVGLRRAKGMRVVELAKEYKVSRQQIYKILNRHD